MKKFIIKNIGLWLLLLFVAAVADSTYRFWGYVERQHHMKYPMDELKVVPKSRGFLCPDPVDGRLQAFVDCTRMYREDI